MKLRIWLGDDISLDQYLLKNDKPSPEKVLDKIWKDDVTIRPYSDGMTERESLEIFWLEYLADEVAGLEIDQFNLVYYHAMLYQKVRVEL